MLSPIVPANRRGFLGNERDVAVPVLEAELADVAPVGGDLAAARVAQPQDQLHQGRLAGAGRTDDPDDLPRFGRERDVAEHRDPVRVFEPDVFEGEVPDRVDRTAAAVHRTGAVPVLLADQTLEVGDALVQALQRLLQVLPVRRATAT